MTSTATGNQNSEWNTGEISHLNIDDDTTEDGVGSNNANLDINSILSQVLGSFNNASLGATEISGGLIFPVIE